MRERLVVASRRRNVRGLILALIESERRVFVGHQRRVHKDAVHPSVQSYNEVRDAARVTADEQQTDDRDEHKPTGEPRARPRSSRGEEAAADEDADDDVLRKSKQPRLDQYEAA